jgi:hypothetical protein
MEPFLEDASRLATQEFSTIVWNQKVDYRTQKSQSHWRTQYTPPVLFLQYSSYYCVPTYVLFFLVISFLLAFPQNPILSSLSLMHTTFRVNPILFLHTVLFIMKQCCYGQCSRLLSLPISQKKTCYCEVFALLLRSSRQIPRE